MNEQTSIVPAAEPVARLPAVQREIRVVNDPIAILDTSRFEHMQRIATVMAESTLMPESLYMSGKGDEREPLDIKKVMANCFLIVNQAVRWNMDPFAVAQCVSVVHGKLCYEGKLIAAVIETKIGADLEYEISGQGDQMKVVVSAAVNGNPVVDSKGRPKIVEGTVAEWKTTGTGSPWAARGGSVRMLRYRGAREWCRVHTPGLMLGVYSPDELEDLSEEARSARAIDVTPKGPPPPAPSSAAPPACPLPPGGRVITTGVRRGSRRSRPRPSRGGVGRRRAERNGARGDRGQARDPATSASATARPDRRHQAQGRHARRHRAPVLRLRLRPLAQCGETDVGQAVTSRQSGDRCGVSAKTGRGEGMTQDQVVALMESSKTRDEWIANCDAVEAACGGYPDFWYAAVILSGLAGRVAARWGSDADIHVVAVRR